MTPALLALSQRAVRAPMWRWVSGMRPEWGFPEGPLDPGPRVSVSTARGGPDVQVLYRNGLTLLGPDHVPDISDQLTVVGLLVLVRDVAPGYPCSVAMAVARWYAGGDIERLAEALVKVLEAAEVET